VNGMVTLRGPVKTEAEKANIDAAARKVSSQIDNQLEVKP
jgi:osmotically-inducible protein OsmY